MKVFLHVISTPFTLIELILVVPVHGKRDGYSSFFLVFPELHRALTGARPFVFLDCQGESAYANMGSTPPRCKPVAGVIFSGHNDVGVHWVHMP